MKYFLIGFCSIVFLFVIIACSSRADIYRQKIYDCVVAKAQQDHYPLSPYGADAYETYYQSCK